MSRIRTLSVRILTLAACLLVFFLSCIPAVNATTVSDPENSVIETTSLEDATPENPVPETPDPEDPNPEDPNPEDPNPEDPNPEPPDPEDPEVDEGDIPVIKTGLVEENGAIYFYNEDGTMFTGGYKEVTVEGITRYYFFQENGKAFTGGYKEILVDGVTGYYFFQEDGSAFTGGLKKVPFGSESYYYFFQKDGKALVSNWGTQSKKKYYFQENGRAVQKTFFTLDKKLYYFDSKAALATGGWFCVDDGYYYADDAGVLATSTVVEGYKLNSKGKSRTKYRIVQYVKKYTDDSMTDQEKIDALYNWVWKNDMKYISSYEHVSSSWRWPAGWTDDFAVDVMDDWGGNCFKFSSFLGLMIREATDLPVIVYHGKMSNGSPHGWITIQQDGAWYLYDVQQAKRGRDQSQIYKVPYPGSPLHLEGIGTNIY